MKIVRKIEFTGKNLNDVFWLPCVKRICKFRVFRNGVLSEDRAYIVCYNNMMRGSDYVYSGHTLVEYTDGKWDIE